MQASAPPVELALSRAGVTGVQKAIRIRRGDAETVMAAEIECTVDLARGQKGVHMSRFPEVFDEAIGDVVLGEARIVEEIAEVIARHIVERQRAVRAEVRITARWPMRRMTPVTGLPTQEMVSLIGIAAATEHGRGASSASRRRGSTPAPAPRGSSPAAQRSGSPTRASTRRRSSRSSSSSRSPPTTSAAGARCSSAPRTTSMPRRSSISSSAR